MGHRMELEAHRAEQSCISGLRNVANGVVGREIEIESNRYRQAGLHNCTFGFGSSSFHIVSFFGSFPLTLLGLSIYPFLFFVVAFGEFLLLSRGLRSAAVIVGWGG